MSVWELYTQLFTRNWRCGRLGRSLSQGCLENSILVTDYLTKMGIKTVPQPPYSPDLAPSDFWLFPKPKENLWRCRYEEMKEAVTKVIDTLTQENFYGAFQKFTTSALKPEEITSKETRVSSLETYWRHFVLSISPQLIMIRTRILKNLH